MRSSILHNNEDFAGRYVGSDILYDYSMVNYFDNDHSATAYYGTKGGEYKSYPLYLLNSREDMPDWVREVVTAYHKVYPNDEFINKFIVEMNETEDFYVSFGSSHLQKFGVNGLDVLLRVSAVNRKSAIMLVQDSVIGEEYCTTYSEEVAKLITKKHGLTVLTWDELMALKLK